MYVCIHAAAAAAEAAAAAGAVYRPPENPPHVRQRFKGVRFVCLGLVLWLQLQLSPYVGISQHISAYMCVVSGSGFVGCGYGCQHTSAYVSIRQHTSAYVSIRQHTSAYVSIRQHTSAYVSIRQHTSAHGSVCLSLAVSGTLCLFLFLCVRYVCLSVCLSV
jgi:hypothetical protein